MKEASRSEGIDFLRGIAVMLVLFSHHWIFTPLKTMGWIGVDLFFVLSGFLVSGLLFSEYKKYGNIRPKLFLIRRGFKIYPLFYFSILITIILQIFFPNAYFFSESKVLFLNSKGILSASLIEVFFLQSFFFGFWGHHWSLSVEEIFYFSLVFFLLILIRKKLLENKKMFLKISLFIFLVCLALRIFANLIAPTSILTFSAAPLRIDSLFAGVLVAYYFHFHNSEMKIFYNKYKKIIWALIIPLIIYTPFIDVLDSFFIKTIGFALIYTSFSLLLLMFLFETEITNSLKKILSTFVFRVITKIGFYSYSIYLFHMYVIRYIVGENYAYAQYEKGEYTYINVLASFTIFFLGSILLGIGMAKIVEVPMLRIRDKHFPRRASSLS